MHLVQKVCVATVGAPALRQVSSGVGALMRKDQRMLLSPFPFDV